MDPSQDPTQATPPPPSIGRIVTYTSRTGDFVVPAIVAATQKTLNRDRVESGLIPDLESDFHVHLVVFSPGLPQAADAEALERVHQSLRESGTPMDVNAGGTFREWNIPYSPLFGWDLSEERELRFEPSDHPGTWCWPEIIRVG